MKITFEVLTKVENGLNGGQFLLHGNLRFHTGDDDEERDGMTMALRVPRKFWEDTLINETLTFGFVGSDGIIKGRSEFMTVGLAKPK